MRPNVARALTAALVTTGVATAIALPTLTLGDARTPPHAFAIHAPADAIEIEATYVPPKAATGHTVRPPSSQPVTPAPVQALPARRSAPIATTRPVARVARAVPVVVPALPAPTPTPTPTPQPEPTPEPPPVRALTFAAPVEEAPDVAAATKDKKPKREKKDKPDKKDKAAASGEPTLAPSPAPAVTGPAAPAEPLPAAAAEDEGKGKGKEHDDDHGKGHDKKK